MWIFWAWAKMGCFSDVLRRKYCLQLRDKNWSNSASLFKTTYFENNLLVAEHHGFLTAFVCRFILSRMHINQIVTHDSQNRSVLEGESLDYLTLTFKTLRVWKESLALINLLEQEFYISILAHPLGKMRIIQKPNKVALWNKRHFKETKTEIMQHV